MDISLLVDPSLPLLFLLPILPLPLPLRRIPRRSIIRIDPCAHLDRISRHNPFLRNLMSEAQASLRMFDIRLRFRHTDDLRPHAQTREGWIMLTVIPDFEINGRIGLSEMFFEFARALVGDGVRGCADGLAHLKDDSSSRGPVARGGPLSEGPFVVRVGGRGVIEGEDAAVAVSGRAAVPDPQQVPAVSVG